MHHNTYGSLYPRIPLASLAGLLRQIDDLYAQLGEARTCTLTCVRMHLLSYACTED